MTRPIKFRGLHSDEQGKKWVYGFFSITHDRPGRSEHWVTNGHSHIQHLVSLDSVGQFTGLLDKNGKEIYEGDIVKYKYLEGFACEEDGWENQGTEKINVVEFWRGEFTPRERSSLPDDGYYAWRTHSFEIIGNIYENPELLK